MTVIELVQRFCRTVGIPSPSSVVGATDEQVLQILALLEEEVNDLSKRHDWNALINEATLTTVATESQGVLSTIAPGFKYIRNNTIWDYTDKLPVLGPLDGQEWQKTKAEFNNGPRYQFRIRGNELLSNPIPVAGHIWKFEYASKNAIQNATTKEYITLDSDWFLLPDDLHLQGLRWRWNREKGLDYAELFNTYELQVKDAIGRDGGASRIYVDSCRYTGPGIVIPPGNWPL